MRRFVNILVVLALTPLTQAFDSAAWLEKREVQSKEAQRLRQVYRQCVARLETPADDVTVPVETYPNGAIKSVVYARKAQYFMKEGWVWAEGVEAKKYKKDGTLDTVIVATNCVIDRIAKAGWADGPATVVNGKTTFHGRNVYFSSPEGYIQVWDDSDILSTDLTFGGYRK